MGGSGAGTAQSPQSHDGVTHVSMYTRLYALLDFYRCGVLWTDAGSGLCTTCPSSVLDFVS